MNFDLPQIVRYLLIINLAFFGLQHLFPVFDQTVALYFVHSEYFHAFQFVTYMFAHANIGHLFGNMLGVFFFAPLLEQVWGPKRFLIFYLATGIGAGILYSGIHYYEIMRIQEGMNTYIAHPSPSAYVQFFSSYFPSLHNADIINFGNSFEEHASDPKAIQESVEIVRTVYEQLSGVNTPMVGASGALFGVLIAFAMLFPNTEMMLLFFPFPIKAKYFVSAYLAYEVWKLIENNPNDNVAHLAHIGGAAIGFVLVKIWQQNRRTFY